MGRLLTRSQLGRVTSRVQFPSFTFTPFKQCSSTPNPTRTANIPASENYRQNLENERLQNRRTVLQFSRNTAILTCDSSAESGICDVYLVGTVHSSEKSCEEVKAIINFLKPEVVFLELCSGSKAVLRTKDLKKPTMKEISTAMLKKKVNMLGLLLTLIIAQIASELNVTTCCEFHVAHEEATKHGGRVVLGDRPVQITLTRAWRKMSLWHKTRLLFGFVGKDSSPVSELKEIDCDIDMDEVTLFLQELAEICPALLETLIHERDLYMSSKLLEVAKKSSCVVAVVGKGHLPGIQKHWKQPAEVNDLLTIPPPKPVISARSIGIAVAGAAILWGLFKIMT